MKKNKKEKFSKSIGYLFVSQFFIKIFGLVYSLYLINKPKFGDEGNAIYLGGYQIFALMLTFSSIGVPNAVANLIAKSNNSNTLKKVFNASIYVYSLIACICGIILYLFSDFIAKNIVGIESVSYNLKLLSPIIIFTTFESVYIGFFNGIKQMKITAKIQFIEQLFKTLFTIIFVEILSRITDSVDVISIGATLGVSLSILISFVICIFEKRNVSILVKNFDKENMSYKNIIKTLLKFSIPSSLGAMFIAINRNSDSYSIMNILSEKIGIESAKKIYGIIASKIDVLVLFPLAFNITFSTALIPNISEAKRNNDNSTTIKIINSAVFFSLIIGIASSMGLYFFSEEIFSLLFANSKDGSELLKIASFSVIFSVLNQTFSGVLQALQKNKIPVLASFIGTICKVVFNYLLLKYTNFEGKGIIVSNIISNIIMFYILYNRVMKIAKVKLKKYFFVNTISSFVMIFCIKLFYKTLENLIVYQKISFFISCVLGIIVFSLETLKIGRKMEIFESKINMNKTKKIQIFS